MSRSLIVCLCALVVVGMFVAEGDSAVRITEFMSEGQGDIAGMNGSRRQREFFELTNLGASAVDVSSWTYNDNNTNDPINWGPEVGSIAVGESVVFTQMTKEAFLGYWGLPASVKVVSYLQLSNLGNGDTINIYNSATQDETTLVDKLTYEADARGSGVSRNRPWDGGQGQFLNPAWVISSVGDNYQSFLAPNATGFPPNFPNAADYTDLANPGKYVQVPEPAAILLGVTGMLMLWSSSRRARVA